MDTLHVVQKQTRYLFICSLYIFVILYNYFCCWEGYNNHNKKKHIQLKFKTIKSNKDSFFADKYYFTVITVSVTYQLDTVPSVTVYLLSPSRAKKITFLPQVFAYYRSLPMPITAHKFGSIDPVSGKETDHANNQFVSSVCWRQKSDMVIAANSSGCLKLLQMV